MTLPKSLEELKDRKVWVCYPMIPNPAGHDGRGSYDKPPVNPRTLRNGSTTNRSTWSDFETAAACIGKPAKVKLKGKEHDCTIRGVGLPLSGSDGKSAFDLDDCLNLEGLPDDMPLDLDTLEKEGRITETAADVIRLMDTYAEASPSNTGVRVIYSGDPWPKGYAKKIKVPGIDGKPADFDIYEPGKYVTITGRAILDKPIADRTKELLQIRAKYWKDKITTEKEPAELPSVALSDTSPADQWSRWQEEMKRLTDQEIWDAILKRDVKNIITPLYKGDLSGYHNNHSEADQALCDYLYQFTHDTVLTDRLFRLSGLYREKWDRDDYRRGTLQKASQCTRYRVGHIEFTKEEKREYARARDNERLIAALHSRDSDETAVSVPSRNKVYTQTEMINLLFKRTAIPGLSLNQFGMPTKAFHNYALIVELIPELSKHLKFNTFSMLPEIEGVYWNPDPHPVDDDDITEMQYLFSYVYGLDSRADIWNALSRCAKRHPYHPIIDRLKSIEWDGVERLPDLLPRYLGAEKSGYTTAATKLLFYGIIQRIMHPGIKFDYCINFVDQKQGGGKSTLARFLALDDQYFCDDLNDFSDADKAYRRIRNVLVVELGEMVATRRAKDVESIKSFLSRNQDNYCEKYEKISKVIPRHCVFIGTTNRPEFLPADPSGNRRFVPIQCHKEKAVRHPLDNEAETRDYIEQCYGEAMYLGELEGWPLVLDKRFQEDLDFLLEDSAPENHMEGLVLGVLEDMVEKVKDSNDVPTVCTLLVFDLIYNKRLRMAFDINKREPQKYELENIAEILNTKAEGWTKYRTRTGKAGQIKFSEYGVQRAWIYTPENCSSPRSSPVHHPPAKTLVDELTIIPRKETPFN